MLQLSSILVPLDGSSFAEQALHLAARLARSSSASLRLVLVHSPSTTWDPGVEFSLFDPATEKQVRAREYAYLESLAKTLSRGGGLHVDCALLNGAIADSLTSYAERTGTDLVVMASHGRGGIGGLVLGNVAEQLVHRLTVPVLVVRPEDRKTNTMPDGGRILVPLDGSPLAESVLEQAATFARLTGAELLLTTIVQPVPVLLPPSIWNPKDLTERPEHRELEARRYLERVKVTLRSEGLTVQSLVRRSSKVATAILDLAREEACRLIAMATHGASGLDRMMLGSVAGKVVRHAEVPVLVLRPELWHEEELDQTPAPAMCELAAR